MSEMIQNHPILTVFTIVVLLVIGFAVALVLTLDDDMNGY